MTTHLANRLNTYLLSVLYVQCIVSNTLGDAKISRPVVPFAYHTGEAGMIRRCGKRSEPYSGKALPHLGVREGRLMALMPFEQNLGEWMEFRHERSCLKIQEEKMKWGNKMWRQNKFEHQEF